MTRVYCPWPAQTCMSATLGLSLSISARSFTTWESAIVVIVAIVLIVAILVIIAIVVIVESIFNSRGGGNR